jgi:hypothetical protein
MSVSTPLHSHMVGFPHYKNREEELQPGIKISMKESQSYNSSAYKSIYEMSNSYLSNGYESNASETTQPIRGDKQWKFPRKEDSHTISTRRNDISNNSLF